jgi:AcrR family transcriptional regulator
VGVILEAAAHILEQQGFEGYTTNSIAERAGVSIGSLYQYYPGKDAITIALIEQESAVLLDAVVKAARMDDWADALRSMIRAATEHQLTRPKLARLLDFEEARLPFPAHAVRVGSTIQAAIAEVLKKCPDRSPEDVAVLAYDILAITRGLTDSAGERGETDIGELERRVIRAVFGYLERLVSQRPAIPQLIHPPHLSRQPSLLPDPFQDGLARAIRAFQRLPEPIPRAHLILWNTIILKRLICDIRWNTVIPAATFKRSTRSGRLGSSRPQQDGLFPWHIGRS